MNEGKNWVIFYLNYLSPNFENNSKELFTNKWKSYQKLFQYWKEKKLENEEIKEIINSLINTKKTFTSLVKKYEKKVNIDREIVEKNLENLWNEELAKKLTTNRQKVQNYLLGQVRKNNPEFPLKEIIIIIDNFLEEKK